MQHELQFSVIEHLRNKFGHQVVWLYDGVKLPDESAKPYFTVQQRQNNNSIIAKQRETARTIYRFQIGLRAKNSSELARLQSQVADTFSFDKITLLDTTQPTVPAVGYFYAELTAVVPIPSNDVTNLTNRHLVYFDIEVDYTKRRQN